MLDSRRIVESIFFFLFLDFVLKVALQQGHLTSNVFMKRAQYEHRL